MGRIYSVYVGPFAEWLVPKDRHRSILRRRQVLVEDFSMSKSGSLDFDGDPREIEVDQQVLIRECWTAYFGLADERAAPPRRFDWSDLTCEVGVWEHDGFDVPWEKSWFAAAFSEQLEKLTGLYGRPPTIKWGVVTRYS